MSISSQITRIAKNVSESLDAVAAKGVTIPTGSNSDDLPGLIAQISSSTAAISVVDTTDTAGGTIRTITALDISDTTAVAKDVLTGKYFYTANGTKTAGTGAGGGVIEAEKKDVNFYDYDGTRLYSYTATEAQALTALPSNPSHTGLTAQGWNWTLAQIKSQLTAMGGVVNVGQNYVTTSGKTEIDITLNDSSYLSPYLCIAVNGTIVIDWGDETSTDSITGTSDSTVKTQGHTYSSTGKYTIKITVSNGHFVIRNNGYAGILQRSTNSQYWNQTTFSNTITEVRIGENALIGQYAFNYCGNINAISIPSTITSIGIYSFARTKATFYSIPSGITELSNHAFDGCVCMKHIAIPSSVTTIGEYAFTECRELDDITVSAELTVIKRNAFYECYLIKKIKMPSNITTIYQSSFYYCMGVYDLTISSGVTTIETQAFYNGFSLETLTIPANVTSIATKAFSGLYTLQALHFLGSTPPTLGASDVFANLRTSCVIYVPTGSLSAYTSAQYYPSSSSYTYVEE